MSTPGQPYRSVKGFFFFIGHIIIILFFALLVRELWHGYQNEKRTILFSKEGHPERITIDNTTNERKTWKDYLSNSKYIHFTFHNKPYEIRYVQDSGWVGPGTKVTLLYDENRDDFMQPGLNTYREPIYKKSKLVDFTVVSLFSPENLWLFFFVVFGLVLIVFVSGVLANLTGLDIISRFMNVLVSCIFIAGAIFITYDAYTYYKYARQVRVDANAVTVPLLDKYRTMLNNGHSSDGFELFYFYSALVHYNTEDRIIPIGERDYNNVNKNEPLNALYNSRMDEMVSQNYSPSYSSAFFVAIVWVLLIFWVTQKLKRRKYA
jgi:hypothetical protein